MTRSVRMGTTRPKTIMFILLPRVTDNRKNILSDRPILLLQPVFGLRIDWIESDLFRSGTMLGKERLYRKRRMKPIVIVAAADAEERLRLVLRTRAGAQDAIPLPPNSPSLHSWTRAGSFCLRRATSIDPSTPRP